MLKTRLLFGTLFSIVFVFLLAVDYWRDFDLFFTMLFALCLFAGIYEFYTIFGVIGKPGERMLISLLLGFIFAYREWLGYHFTTVNRLFGDISPFLLWVFSIQHVLLLLAIAVAVLAVIRRYDIVKILAFCCGIFYVWYLFRYVSAIRHLELIGHYALWYFVAVNKVTDSAAFFTGKYLGKTKLAPNVSPKKTVEGAFGGLVFGVCAGLLCWYLTPLKNYYSLPVIAVISVIVSVFSQIGDLLESLIKRSQGVKDSASLFPEFGGVLDIIDGMIISAPPAFFGLYLLIK